jgi:tRNA U34 5-methylaminomethyl-2-thiouridine-forming methyltransferase MnmC
MEQNSYELLISGDGSHTIKHALFDAWYHSIHGAIAESEVVFINANLLHPSRIQTRKPIRIFEMGFGTGLNALMTYIACLQNYISVEYHTVEAYPISIDTALTLNYDSILGHKAFFECIHQADWDMDVVINDHFTIHKYKGLVEEISMPESMDAVYYDAFAPSCQESLWKVPILSKMYSCLSQGGILTSYCSQGEFRRQLQACGFNVERIPGPPHKREMIRATK